MTQFTVYHKQWCPFCKRAMRLLDQLGWDYQAIDVEADRTALNEMLERSNRQTVPQIFLGDRHIGGCGDLFDFVERLVKQQKVDKKDDAAQLRAALVRENILIDKPYERLGHD